MFLDKIIKSFKKNPVGTIVDVVDMVQQKNITIDTRGILTRMPMFQVIDNVPDAISMRVTLKKNYINDKVQIRARNKGRVISKIIYGRELNSSFDRDILLESNSNIKSIDMSFVELESMSYADVTKIVEASKLLPFELGDTIATKNFGYLSEDLEMLYEDSPIGKSIVLSGTNLTSPLIPYGGFYQIGASPMNIQQTYVILTTSTVRSKQLIFLTIDDISTATNGNVDLDKTFAYGDVVYGFVKNINTLDKISLGEFIELGGVHFKLNNKEKTEYESSKYSFNTLEKDLVHITFKRRENV